MRFVYRRKVWYQTNISRFLRRLAGVLCWKKREVISQSIEDHNLLWNVFMGFVNLHNLSSLPFSPPGKPWSQQISPAVRHAYRQPTKWDWRITGRCKQTIHHSKHTGTTGMEIGEDISFFYRLPVNALGIPVQKCSWSNWRVRFS